MVKSIILIIIGFILLIKGADLLVDGSSNIAKKFNIPEIIIGLTIVSIGTSMPELFVSITSALEGYSDMSIGNVVGSNISNLLLILGLSTIIKTITFQKETKLIEIPMCLVVTIIFMIVANINQDINRIDAIILIILFIMFIVYTIIIAMKGQKSDKQENNKEIIGENTKQGSTLKSIIYIIIGIVALKYGGDLTINAAVEIARYFNWSEKLIGLTILAVGTSLPELVTNVSAAIKGKSDIAIGNIIGSNIFNILLIIGTSAVIQPITYNLSYNKDMIILIVSTALLGLFTFVPPKNKMSRMNGIIYVLMYVGYVVSLFI